MSTVKKLFKFDDCLLSQYLARTTEGFENFNQEKIKWNLNITPLQGTDSDIEKALTELQNPELVFSLMLHCLGRGLLYSNKIFTKFKRQLKSNLQKSCEKVIPKDTEYVKKICRLETAFGIEELITPYNELYLDYETYRNETISWDEYVHELELRQTVMDNLRENCNRYTLNDTQHFLPDLYSNLHFDNFCWKSLRTTILKETIFKNERTIRWQFPFNVSIKIQQIRESNQNRTDFVVHQKMTKEMPFKYKHIMKEANIIESLKSVLIELNSDDLKNSSSKQIIYETVLTIFGIEVIKNPAALIYNMMMIDLIEAKKATPADFFHTRERDGILPYESADYPTAANYLNTYYSQIFSHWHSYEKTDENEAQNHENQLGSPNADLKLKQKQIVEKFLKREYDLVYKWISLKAETNDRIMCMRTVKDLWKILIENTKLWYEPLGLILE